MGAEKLRAKVNPDGILFTEVRRLTPRDGVGTRVEIEGLPPWELDLVADTLWIDNQRAICTVTWRGQLPLDGAADTPPFAIQDLLPAGLQVAAAPNASPSCTAVGTAPAFAPLAGDTTLTALGGTVTAGMLDMAVEDAVPNGRGGWWKLFRS